MSGDGEWCARRRGTGFGFTLLSSSLLVDSEVCLLSSADFCFGSLVLGLGMGDSVCFEASSIPKVGDSEAVGVGGGSEGLGGLGLWLSPETDTGGPSPSSSVSRSLPDSDFFTILLSDCMRLLPFLFRLAPQFVLSLSSSLFCLPLASLNLPLPGLGGGGRSGASDFFRTGLTGFACPSGSS